MCILHKDLTYFDVLSFLKLLERYINIDVEDYDRTKAEHQQMQVLFIVIRLTSVSITLSSHFSWP